LVAAAHRRNTWKAVECAGNARQEAGWNKNGALSMVTAFVGGFVCTQGIPALDLAELDLENKTLPSVNGVISKGSNERGRSCWQVPR
jgi:hypothetical protein